MTTFGFLHTADVHVGSFTRLLDEISPDDRAVHVVDPSLLTDARRRGGVDDDLRVRMGGRVRELSARGAVRVVCTCSTIGGPAEEIGRQIGVPVRRVDRPMARVAVAAGDDIAVVAALEATIEPTHRLLRETADAVGRPVRIVDAPCPAAWSHFEAGDGDRYLATLAAHLESLDDRSDVIVLAQASMAPVEALVRVTALVLSSPRPAVMDLVHRS